MGNGVCCKNEKVIEYTNRNRPQNFQSFDNDQYIHNIVTNDSDNVRIRKIIYGMKNGSDKSMYDAIFKCESINKLYQNKWTYTLYNRFVERLQKKNEDKKFCTICLIGETNKGKTFLLNLLTDNELQSGTEYRTVGLSCKFTDFSFEKNMEEEENQKEKKFLIFDSAGRSEPLLIDPDEKQDLVMKN